MRIKTFQISNFKCFDDSGLHQLEPHMNVIVGKNNSGKTTLLKAIAQQISLNPHKNSKQRPTQPLTDYSYVDITFEATKQEVKDILLSEDGIIQLPFSSGSEPMDFFNRPTVTIRGRYGAIGKQTGPSWLQVNSPSIDIGAPNDKLALLRRNEFRTDLTVSSIADNAGLDNIALIMGAALSRATYLFDALRAPKARFAFGDATRLAPDASNLAQVLNTFQPSPTSYRKYIEEVRRVIPLIKWVSVGSEGGELEIRVWNVDEATGRDDLSHSLLESGTGIGQVLAILYVVLRSKGSVLLIDEPNSFLHPGAAKALMAILRERVEHQFVIATHSPEIVSVSHTERLMMVDLTDERAEIKNLERAVESARLVLEGIGSNLSDVFGANAVIWVEGPTEVDSFPMLMRAAGKQLEPGVVFARLRSTGDLEGRHAKAIADIYRNLNAAGSLLPPSLVISLDGDKRQSTKVSELKRVFGDIIRFLPRHIYENYLLHPQAVSELLNTLPTFKDNPVQPSRIKQWIEENGQERKYAADQAVFSEAWFKRVDGALLIKDLVTDLSDSKSFSIK